MKRQGRFGAGRHAFTLLEVLIAMVVFSVGLLALATTSAIVMKQDARSNKMATATTLAHDRLEELTRVDYNAIVDQSAASVAGESWASRAVDVTSDSPMAGVKKVIVTVSWTGHNGQDHAVALKTLRSK